jgi:hypothetical protein
VVYRLAAHWVDVLLSFSAGEASPWSERRVGELSDPQPLDTGTIPRAG